MELWAVWLIVAGVLLIIEMFTLTFYLLWFGLGLVAAAVVGLFITDSVIVQIIVGSITVLALTVFTRPLTRRFRRAGGFKDAVDELVGKRGFVLEPIAKGKHGVVKVGSETWSAVSDETLAKGEPIVVVERGSAILQVIRSEGVE
ncbi:MAG: hypothetical protein K0Q59_3689 [Paenibacillus sp.]|nr:hypothetical protein [Paenibacillus sp.]